MTTACLTPERQIASPIDTLTESERHVLATLRKISFGSIKIVVHDGRVVQIEPSEKKRFDKTGNLLTQTLS